MKSQTIIQTKKLINKLMKETVLVISAIAAIISMVFIPLDRKYLTYIDFRVLGILFCLMAVISGLQSVGVFDVLSMKLLKGVKGTRMLIYVLILACFFSSMWITNDVSLIAFVPFTILVLTKTNKEKYMIFVIVMQTIAANLGSMLTPVGNPQNLYLYTYYQVPVFSFFQITIPIVVLAFILISIIMVFIKNESIEVKWDKEESIQDLNKLFIYIILFLMCLATVFHLIHYILVLIITFILLLVFDKTNYKKIDYSLLATFVCFFVFVGNIGRIDSINESISIFMKGKELLSSILVSQGISNVPAAILLSSFTKNYKSLILGTNIGGLGTLIASLASLISFRLYLKTEEAKSFKYLFQFTLYNLFFLCVLIGFCMIF